MRSINLVMLAGNLTRDPELKHTQSGKTVCTFGLATNRNWTSEDGEKKEQTDFHRIVAWGRLGETCKQYLKKGRRVWVKGRVHADAWTDTDGVRRSVTEIVIDDMIMLDSKPQEQPAEVVTEPNGQQVATAV